MKKLVILSLLVATACAEPAMETGEAPVVVMNFTDTNPATSVSSEDDSRDGAENCVKMRATGAVHRVLVSARDSGGLRAVSVSSFDGELTVADVGPDAATVSVSDTVGGQQVLMNYPAAPDGEVYVSSLIVLDVRPNRDVVSLSADAIDRSGNGASTGQFDLRDPSDGVACRGA